MDSFSRILTTLFVAMISFSVWARSDSNENCLSMHVVLNDSSGYIDKNGKLVGYHVDFIDELEKHSGFCIDKKLLPYSRALHNLKYGKNEGGIIASASALDGDVHYVSKLFTAETVVIPKRGININSIDDLSTFRIGRLRGAEIDDKQVLALNLSLIDISNYEQGLRLIKNGRIEAIIGNSLGLSIIKDRNMLDLVNLSGTFSVGNREVWFVVSRKFTAEDKIVILRQAAQKIIEQGILDKILVKHFGEENMRIILKEQTSAN